MATLAYVEPQITANGNLKEPDIFSGPMTGTLVRGDLVKLASGNLTKCATNDNANIVGIMAHGSVDVPSSSSPTDATLFGQDTIGSALTPAEPGNGHVIQVHNNQYVEMSCVQARAAANVGTTFGILLDGTSGKFVADNTQVNKPLTLIQYVEGPNKGVSGDIGARAIFQFAATAVI